ncbi:MAG: hypothetical protein GF344_01960, partial [Chitinivibrionales bacterium]|nr:hypothetical protein [Chitinivibrionales bacterium]MBD3355860.1 hypothetical protein [Chitinivibrionales bacterium]
YKLTKETIAPGGNTDNLVGTDERFEVLKFNTQLQVTPWVMDSGYVMVEIRPEFNIPRSGGDPNSPPNVDTRVLESMVRLRDGQTIVLGGQRQTENIIKGRGVPFLSSIPILGWLFSDKQFAKVETQMMIFLTPHVYYGDEGTVSPDDYFGDEINRMLDKHDPDRLRRRIEERRENRREKREEERREEKGNEVTTLIATEAVDENADDETKEKKKIRWPWQRREQADTLSEPKEQGEKP